jgi:hypothetical protein
MRARADSVRGQTSQCLISEDANQGVQVRGVRGWWPHLIWEIFVPMRVQFGQ